MSCVCPLSECLFLSVCLSVFALLSAGLSFCVMLSVAICVSVSLIHLSVRLSATLSLQRLAFCGELPA